jgi:REP element-mobilizing transposase RayT
MTTDANFLTFSPTIRFSSSPSAPQNAGSFQTVRRDIVMEACLCGDGHRFELHALVVMPDHVHLVFTPRWDPCGTFSIPEIMQEIKSVSAHRINRQTGHVGRVWQEESFDRALRREEALGAKIEYMIANPVRAGLVSTSAEYRWIWIEGLESSSTGGAPAPPSRWAV